MSVDYDNDTISQSTPLIASISSYPWENKSLSNSTIMEGFDQVGAKDIISTGNHAYALAAILSISICVLILLIIAYTVCNSSHDYSQISEDKCPDEDEWTKCRLEIQEDKEFMYNPGNGGHLDEEYTNTFVGVSIPLLQDVSKV